MSLDLEPLPHFCDIYCGSGAKYLVVPKHEKLQDCDVSINIFFAASLRIPDGGKDNYNGEEKITFVHFCKVTIQWNTMGVIKTVDSDSEESKTGVVAAYQEDCAVSGLNKLVNKRSCFASRRFNGDI